MTKKQKQFNPELCHDLLVSNVKQKLGYDDSKLLDNAYKNALKERFIELVGLDVVAENSCPLNFEIEWEEDKGFYRLIRFTIESEIGETVPCYILIPKGEKKKYPVAITLQGHTTGFHNSIGDIKNKQEICDMGYAWLDCYEHKVRNQFAVQAVKNGYVAVAIEQRGMGERKAIHEIRSSEINCRWTYRVALMLGRTLIGERIWDTMRVIDVLSNFPECDMDKILITGNSGGGTLSYYAGCVDERIKLIAPSCAFCTYADSILAMSHCGCNYIPNAYRWFEMQDLSSLIAPRNLVLFNGKLDEIFPIEGVRKGFEVIKKIYAKSGVENNCRLVETPKDHYWCDDIVWKEINAECEKLGWR